jgi:hypothetical protein
VRSLAVAILALALLPAASQAAVPATFFGANWDAEISKDAPAAVQEREWERMSQTGVRTTRAAFEWVKIETEPDEYDFTVSDRVVRMAAMNDVEVLPVVMYAPPWEREQRGNFSSPPKNPKHYARFLDELVKRYGGNGSFWVENPQLPWKPIRYWQVWNEPHLPYQWDGLKRDDWARDYGRLLRLSYKAVHDRDARAKVVLAGLTNKSWTFLDALYKRGDIRRSFDVAALHPYTRTARGVVTLTKRFRRVMRRHRDGRRPIWITELGLPASRGRHDSDSLLQTDDQGMAEFLSSSYKAVARARRGRAAVVDRVYWYTWASVYCCTQFRFTGLLQYDNRETVEPKPAFGAYAGAVQSLGGRPAP